MTLKHKHRSLRHTGRHDGLDPSSSIVLKDLFFDLAFVSYSKSF
jgi:hypothetical protein